MILSERQGMLLMPELGSLMLLLRGSTSISVDVLNRTNVRFAMGWGETWTVCVQRMAYGESAATGRGKEQVARFDNNLWLCDRGLESFPGATLIDRRVGWEQAMPRQRSWRSEDSITWARMPIQHSRQQRLTGPQEGPLEKYAACEWAVVRMDHEGGMIPWCGVGSNMPVEFAVQRTIKSADILVHYMRPCPR